MDLPRPSTESLTAKASDVERILYTAVELRQADLRKEKFDDDDPRKELSNKLAQITCLRQFVSFPRFFMSIADEVRLTANPDLIEDEIMVCRFSHFLDKLSDQI